MTRSVKKQIRRYFRHPAQVPVICRQEGHCEDHEGKSRDIGFGGMALICGRAFEPGDTVAVDYPTLDADSLKGEVVWSDILDDGTHRHMCGIRFPGRPTFLRARMIEQLCRMEVYRRAQHETHGRRIGREEAAREWVENTAKRFPR